MTSPLPQLSESEVRRLTEFLSLPKPSSIEALQVTAAFHSIYLLNFSHVDASALQPPGARLSQNKDGSTSLILRISGDHLPARKTNNEVAVMKWVRQNTSMPVPAVVRFDSSTNNPINREFTLLERMPGKSVDSMYNTLDEATKQKLVQQLTAFVVELNAFDWHHIGGLHLDGTPAPVIEDTFWFVPDVETHWAGTGMTVDTLNPRGPYDSHGEYVAAYLACYIAAIRTHESLSWLKDTIPRFEALIAKLPSLEGLDKTKLVLAHKDLHFANIMATENGTVTAVLDWEFAGVVPVNRWDPVRAFLWSGEYSESADAEKAKLRAIFESRLQDDGVDKWWEEGIDTNVMAVWDVLRFVRALVEVCPRGQRAEQAKQWHEEAKIALTKLGV